MLALQQAALVSLNMVEIITETLRFYNKSRFVKKNNWAVGVLDMFSPEACTIFLLRQPDLEHNLRFSLYLREDMFIVIRPNYEYIDKYHTASPFFDRQLFEIQNPKFTCEKLAKYMVSIVKKCKELRYQNKIPRDQTFDLLKEK